MKITAMILDSVEPTTVSSGNVTTSEPSISSTEPHQSINNFVNGTTGLEASVPISDWSLMHQCLTWDRPPNHLYFQLGNALFLIAFLAPHGSHSLLCARCALVLGSALLTMWGYLIECQADVVVWNGSFLVINLVYLLTLLYRLRPIRFDKEIEAVSKTFIIISIRFIWAIHCVFLFHLRTLSMEIAGLYTKNKKAQLSID